MAYRRAVGLMAAVLVACAAGRGVYGEEAAPAHPGDKPAVTTGTLMTAGGRELSYTATAAYMPLKDESGKLRARIFYTAYTAGSGGAPPTTTAPATASAPATGPVDPANGGKGQDPKRPLIFLFNGGPGAASVWLHLGAVGPKRLDVPEDGSAPKPPYRTVENRSSWLSDADLVFVDPVGTGYSRAADPEKAKEFYGVKEDIESVGEFVRLFLTKNQRWSSPIYLAGESYGTTRVAGLAPYLQERAGVSVNGIILVSTVLNFGALAARGGNDLPYALNLPTYAALHWYHPAAGVDRKQAPLENVLKQAEDFALNEYTVALAKGSSLPDADRKAIAAKLASFTGLSESYILESNLRIPSSRFQKELLRDQNKIIGRFDGRLTGMPLDPPNDAAEYDPSLSGFYPAYTSAFNDYVRRTLKYENDLPYEVLSNSTRPWNYTSGGASNAFLYVGDDLKTAMTANPHLKLLVCSGRYDLATPYFGVVYTLNHLHLAKELQANITQTFYPGGHMMYHTKENLEALHKNVEAFLNPAK